MTPEEHYMFRPSMFFEDRYQITDAKGTPIGVGRDLSDAAMLTRHLNEARTSGIREQVEPLEAWKESAIKVLGEWDKVHEALGKPGKLGESMAAASLAEVQKLRALVQELTNRLHKERLKYSDIVDMLNIDHGLLSAKEQGFVPTNTEDK